MLGIPHLFDRRGMLFLGTRYSTDLYQRFDENDVEGMYKFAVYILTFDYVGQKTFPSSAYKKAELCLTKAAEKGYKDARHFLAYQYEKGDYFKNDKKKALYWYEKAAEQDNEWSADARKRAATLKADKAIAIRMRTKYIAHNVAAIVAAALFIATIHFARWLADYDGNSFLEYLYIAIEIVAGPLTCGTSLYLAGLDLTDAQEFAFPGAIVGAVAGFVIPVFWYNNTLVCNITTIFFAALSFFMLVRIFTKKRMMLR